MKDWENILKTGDEAKYKGFLTTLPNYRVISTIKNKKCVHGTCSGDHKMILRYMKCTSKKCRECQVKYRTVECANTQTYYVDKLTNSEHAYHKYNQVLERDKDDKRGIPDNVKDLIMRFITEQDIIKPYRLRIELSKLYDENKINFLPTKVQIQNHISYLKKI